MPIQPPTPDELLTLVGMRHEATGLTYPPRGMQPYYDWLLQSLHLLAESGFAALRVARDDANATSITVASGRATIDGNVTVFPGDTIDLAAFNNDTALIWLEQTAGMGAIGITDSATDWPATPHLKLAEATVDAGTITAILDRRFEAVFSV